MNKKILASIFGLIPLLLFSQTAYHVTHQPVADGHILEFELNGYQFKEVVLNGRNFTKIYFDHQIVSQQKGYAELPYIHASVALEPDKNTQIEVLHMVVNEELISEPLVPSRGSILRSQDPSAIPYEIAPASLSDSWYPEVVARQVEPFILRDIRGTTVFVNPFRYNAVQQKVQIIESITVKLTYTDETPVNPIINNPGAKLESMDGLYRSIFVNYDNSRDDLTLNELGDILVITTARDEDAIQPWIEWKKQKGFQISKTVVDPDTHPASIIQNAYSINSNLLYVQLVGDWNEIKSGISGMPKDPVLGCVAGNDHFPDLIIGRFSANSAADVTTQVNKVLQYEKEVTPASDWYSVATAIASNEGPGDDQELDFEHLDVIFNDKQSPFTYTMLNTVYEPSATKSQIFSAVNTGTSVINYTGHGSPSSWGTTGFNINDVNQLTNGDMLPFIISVACNNGDFHNGTCFAEAWVRKQNGGAIMMLAANISQPWNPPMRGQDYFTDVLIGGYDYDEHPGQNGINTNQQRTTIGSSVFNGLVLMYTESQGSDDLNTIQTWNIFGDATLQLRTEAPMDMTLSNEVVMVGVPFETTISSGGEPLGGVSVTFTQDGDMFTGLTSDEGFVSIDHELLPGEATMVVTGFNCATIYQIIEVEASEGAYIVLEDYIFNDEDGNGNVDFGENILISARAANVGDLTAEAVDAAISAQNTEITIVDDMHMYGDIAPDEVVEGPDAFEVVVADNIADMTTIELLVGFSSLERGEWYSSMYMTVYAPAFEFGDMSVLDMEDGNGNGILDPGEAIEFSLITLNTGHADAGITSVSLSSESTELTVSTDPVSFETFPAGSEQNAVFEALVSDEAQTGTEILLTAEIVFETYTATADFILVIGEIPQVLMHTGDMQTCMAYFYDTGGADDEYENAEDFTMTFMPGWDNAIIEIEFSSFDLESNYDFMWIYDGPDTDSEEFEGSPFTGSTLPESIRSSHETGMITVVFTSDSYVTAQGWEAVVKCLTITGTDEKDLQDVFSIYPNPAKQLINISSVTPIKKVSLYKLSGQLLKELSNVSQHEIQLSIESLPQGIYLLKLESESGEIAVEKLIKQ